MTEHSGGQLEGARPERIFLIDIRERVGPLGDAPARVAVGLEKELVAMRRTGRPVTKP